jgi:cysteine desulfurase
MRVGETIYLDHQATTPVDSRVYDEMVPFFREAFGNPHSLDHIIGWRAAKAVDLARHRIAKLVGCENGEVFFTSGATESNNLALLGLAKRNKTNKKRIIISSIEHKSVLESCRYLEKYYGYILDIVPVDCGGFINMEYFEKKITEDVLFVSILFVNNEIGTIQNIKKIGEISSKSNVIFHCDASQAPCSVILDIDRFKIDLLSISSHKIYGPQGVGALIVRSEIQGDLGPLFFGGEQQGGLRPGTLPLPLLVGFGKAAELICSSDFDQEISRINELRFRFLDNISRLGILFQLNGPPLENRHQGNLNLMFPEINNQDLLAALQPHIAASTGSACTSGFSHASHVLRSIGLTEIEANSSVRFSLGRFTTQKDVDDATTLITNGIHNLTL